MKQLITILTATFMITTAMAQNGKATTVKTTFHRETSVSIDIKADAAIIWSLLTNASDFSRWNSTVISIEGNIKLGEKIKIKSKLAPEKTFKVDVKIFEPEKKLAWGDSKGLRVYTITNNGNGIITFSMTEKLGGLMYPMYKKYIPSFDENFEQWVKDLKTEAEAIMKTK